MEPTEIIIALVAGVALAMTEVFHRYRVRLLKRDILRDYLSDERWTWRTIEALQRVIRADAETTRELLLEIGAKASVKDKEVWTLGNE